MQRAGALWVMLCLLGAVAARAGDLGRAELERYFPPPLILGEKDDALPVWPIFKQNATADELVAYVFESKDLAPLPGFSGTPINLLVALAPDGAFLDVKVISFHEPVFVDGLGPEPLFDFVKQYKGKSLKQSIKVGPPSGGGGDDGAVAVVDGVAKATASLRILNESLLTAGLAVARAKLGFVNGRDPSRASRPRLDFFEQRDWAGLLDAGFVKHYRLSNRQADAAFAGTDGEGLDRVARAEPDAAFVDLYVGELDAPTVGRNLIGDAAFSRLIADLDGRRALFVLSTARFSFMGDDYVPGAVPTRITLAQSGAPVEIRDFAWRAPFPAPGLPAGDLAVFVIKPQTGWDPGAPASLALRVTREKGQILPERVGHDFAFDFAVPASLLIAPPPEAPKGFRAVWRDHAYDVAALVAALALLAGALTSPKQLTASMARLRAARYLFLAFTLTVIGWRWQAQLSIVTLIGVVRAFRGQGSLGFLLYDPPSLVLWAFTLLTLVVWGRGTFCGWLCPFGALQEFAGELGRLLRLPQWRPSAKTDARLRNLKYVALAAIVAAALLSSSLAERVAEIEPFKTAITLSFMREAPYVIYAGGLVVGGAVSFKFFCRYLCPLGAAFAVIGLARRWDWIARRVECGDPCQLCRVKCRYGAIAPSGAVVYHECFQCLDCVAIHDDARQCVPLVLRQSKARALAPRKAARI